MANEWVLKVRLADPVNFTVADGATIEKGTLLKLTDPRTASASDTAGEMCAGVSAMEKVANDGRTQLAVYQRGIFDVYASGAITVGQGVMSAGVANEVKVITSDAISGAARLGYALETATDQETIEVFLNVGGG